MQIVCDITGLDHLNNNVKPSSQLSRPFYTNEHNNCTICIITELICPCYLSLTDEQQTKQHATC